MNDRREGGLIHPHAVGDGNPTPETPNAIMAFDPLYSSNPSDSGLLDGLDLPISPSRVPRRYENQATNVPSRDEYVAPEPGEVDSASPEDSLRDVPLPDGYMARLRGLVNDL